MPLHPYGYWDFVPGEESSTEWMPHTDFNWARIAIHSHDGVDSAVLPASAAVKTTQSLLAAAWVVLGAGYVQSVTMPGALTFTNSMAKFYVVKVADPFDGAEFYPTIIQTGVSSYDIYCNDNTIGVRVLYV